MTGGWWTRVAGWLLPDDERGRAVLGDLEELHAAWWERRGAVEATGRVLIELAASVPPLLLAACLERREAGLLSRSALAVLVGGVVGVAPLCVTGAALGPMARIVATALVGVVSALAGGWLAAAVAGAAPRQHALLVGLGLAASGVWLTGAGNAGRSFTGAGLLLLPAMALAATAGGAWYRHLRRPGRP